MSTELYNINFLNQLKFISIYKKNNDELVWTVICVASANITARKPNKKDEHKQ